LGSFFRSSVLRSFGSSGGPRAMRALCPISGRRKLTGRRENEKRERDEEPRSHETPSPSSSLLPPSPGGPSGRAVMTFPRWGAAGGRHAARADWPKVLFFSFAKAAAGPVGEVPLSRIFGGSILRALRRQTAGEAEDARAFWPEDDPQKPKFSENQRGRKAAATGSDPQRLRSRHDVLE